MIFHEGQQFSFSCETFVSTAWSVYIWLIGCRSPEAMQLARSRSVTIAPATETPMHRCDCLPAAVGGVCMTLARTAHIHCNGEASGCSQLSPPSVLLSLAGLLWEPGRLVVAQLRACIRGADGRGSSAVSFALAFDC